MPRQFRPTFVIAEADLCTGGPLRWQTRIMCPRTDSCGFFVYIDVHTMYSSESEFGDSGLELPDIPYFTGALVFQPQSPASRNEATREMNLPYFN